MAAAKDPGFPLRNHRHYVLVHRKLRDGDRVEVGDNEPRKDFLVKATHEVPGRPHGYLQAADKEHLGVHFQEHRTQRLPLLHRAAIPLLQETEQATEGPGVPGE